MQAEIVDEKLWKKVGFCDGFVLDVNPLFDILWGMITWPRVRTLAFWLWDTDSNLTIVDLSRRLFFDYINLGR